MRVSMSILRSINSSGFFDYVMRGDMPDNGKPPLDDMPEPQILKTHTLRHHFCPECGSYKVVTMRLGNEVVHKCATEGCSVPANLFVDVRNRRMGVDDGR